MASAKTIRTRTLPLLVGLLIASVPRAFAQTPGAASSTTSAAGSTPSAPSAASASGAGTLAIESQAIAYEAIDDLAHVIAGRMRSCPDAQTVTTNPKTTAPPIARAATAAEKYDPESMFIDIRACIKGKVLLGTAANIASLTAFEGFKAAAMALATSYQNVPKFTGLTKPDIGAKALTEGIDATTLGPLGSAAASLLTAAKAQTTVDLGSRLPVLNRKEQKSLRFSESCTKVPDQLRLLSCGQNNRKSFVSCDSAMMDVCYEGQ